jgi:hypothetical protein
VEGKCGGCRVIDELQMTIAKLQLNEGDVLVVKVNAQLSMETHRRIQDHFDKIIPEVRKMILGQEFELSVVVPHKSEDADAG